MLLCLLVLQKTLNKRGHVASLSTVNFGTSALSLFSTCDPTFPWDIFNCYSEISA